MKENYYVLLALVNIFQVQSAKLKEIHDFINIPTLPYHAIKHLQKLKTENIFKFAFWIANFLETLNTF